VVLVPVRVDSNCAVALINTVAVVGVIVIPMAEDE
jgi:hypothetical protein